MNKIYIIVAVDDALGFGKDGKIPWHHPEDLKHYKTVTQGSGLIMGRNTYEDMLGYVKNGKFMPSRRCAVITSKDEPSPWENVVFVKTLQEAIEAFQDFDGNVFFIGGERVFESALNIADGVYLTRIPGNFNCDRFFPMEKLLDNYELVNTETIPEKGLMFKEYKHKDWN